MSSCLSANSADHFNNKGFVCRLHGVHLNLNLRGLKAAQHAICAGLLDDIGHRFLGTLPCAGCLTRPRQKAAVGPRQRTTGPPLLLVSKVELLRRLRLFLRQYWTRIVESVASQLLPFSESASSVEQQYFNCYLTSVDGGNLVKHHSRNVCHLGNKQHDDRSSKIVHEFIPCHPHARILDRGCQTGLVWDDKDEQICVQSRSLMGR